MDQYITCVQPDMQKPHECKMITYTLYINITYIVILTLKSLTVLLEYIHVGYNPWTNMYYLHTQIYK